MPYPILVGDEYEEDLRNRNGGLISSRKEDREAIEAIKRKIALGQMDEEERNIIAHRNPGAADEWLNTPLELSAQESKRKASQRKHIQRSYLSDVDVDGKKQINPYLTELEKSGVTKARINYLRENPYATKEDVDAALQEADIETRQSRLDERYKRGLRGRGGLKGQKIPSSVLQKQIIDVILADPELSQIEDDQQIKGMAANVNLRSRALMDQDTELTAAEAVDQALEEERQYFKEKDPGTRFVPFTGGPATYSRPRGQARNQVQTPEAVREAYRAGKIDRATARKLLEAR